MEIEDISEIQCIEEGQLEWVATCLNDDCVWDFIDADAERVMAEAKKHCDAECHDVLILKTIPQRIYFAEEDEPFADKQTPADLIGAL